jgi:hypothetical protein
MIYFQWVMFVVNAFFAAAMTFMTLDLARNGDGKNLYSRLFAVLFLALSAVAIFVGI